MINLCNNAVHAMNGKGRLLIRLDHKVLKNNAATALGLRQKAGHYLIVTVEDDGSGIPDRILGKIFDPFFTTKGTDEGTGMGLSTVYGIVKQYDGFIEVTSQVGQGTRFELYFPVLQSTDTRQDHGQQSTELFNGGEQILLVDDEKMLTDLGQLILSEYGYRVKTVNDSREALKLYIADADAIDLVITDHVMPFMTGKELIGEIQKIKPEQKIILCTGDGTINPAKEAGTSGVSAFLMKPLIAQELAEVVRRVLDS